MTRYKHVKNLIENDKERFIGWVAVKWLNRLLAKKTGIGFVSRETCINIGLEQNILTMNR